MDNIRLFVSTVTPQPQILCISESWFHCAVSDNYINMPNYSVFRDDRVGRCGGGVAVWTVNYLLCNRVSLVHPKPCDFDCVFLHFYKLNIFLSVLCIPPLVARNSCVLISNYIVNEVYIFLNINPGCKVIITGDLNRFDITFLCEELCLISKVNEPTLVNGNATLDFVLISENLSDRYSVTVESPVSTSDHKSVLCVPNTILKDNSSFFKHIVYDYRHSNIVNFVLCVKNIDWNLLIASDIDVNSKCDIFQTTLNDCFVNCIPTNEVYMTNCEPPWFTPLLKLLINQRWERAILIGIIILKSKLKI